MRKPIYFAYGTKAEYNASQVHAPETLYWCSDTRELFKGDSLYSDGMRVADTYASLPQPSLAAEGKLYLCSDTGCGYLLNDNKTGYDLVLHGIDGQTLGYTPGGLIEIRQVPLEAVTGLAQRLSEIQAASLDGSIATFTTVGVIKPSGEFSVSSDGTLSLVAVTPAKVTGLNERLEQLEYTVTWQSMDS